jgi:putative transcriptional regulator
MMHRNALEFCSVPHDDFEAPGMVRAIEPASSVVEAPKIEPATDRQAERKKELKVDVAAIRSRVGGTQDSFARMIGIPPGTVRNWEHGRRVPTGAACVLLDLLASDPDIVSGMLRKIAVAKATTCASGAVASAARSKIDGK